MKKISLVLFAMCFIVACSTDSVHRCEAPVFGTYYMVTYCGDEDEGLQAGLDSLFVAFSAEFSMFDSSSVVSRLNRGEDLLLSEDFVSLLQVAGNISKQTGGAFDVTIAPLVQLWGFGPESFDEINDQKIDSALKKVGYDKIAVVNHRLVKQNDGVQLDFGAIAKGLAVDKVSEFMKKRGHDNFLVDIGGEIRTAGSKYGKQWRIGVQVPTQDKDGVIASDYDFPLNDKAVATSGNYRNFYEIEGKRYSHIINPLTGYSERSDLLSVTVISADCMTADAYATAFMVMGKEESLEWLQAHPELAAYFIYYEEGVYEVEKTPNFP